MKELSLSNIAAAAEAAFVHFEQQPETWTCGMMGAYAPQHCFSGQMALEMGADDSTLVNLGYRLSDFCWETIGCSIIEVNDGAGYKRIGWLSARQSLFDRIVAPLQELCK